MTWELFWFALPRMLLFAVFIFVAWRIATWQD
jgi:hypothetical protein